MIKKIFVFIGVLFSFFLMFLLGFDKINILAMGNFDNSIGTIPIQIDINNYNRKNLIDYNNFNFNYNNFYSTTSQYIYNDIKTVSATNTSTNLFGVNRFNFYGDFQFKDNTFYTISFDRTAPESGNYYTIGFEQYNIPECPSVIRSIGNTRVYYTFNSNCILNTDYTFQKSLTIYLNKNAVPTQTQFYIYNFMLYEGTEQLPYSSFFKFGYNASLSYVINTTSSTTINYYFNDNTYTKSTSIVDSGYLIENYYIPFNIDSKGYISFPNIYFGISSISNSNSNNTYSLQLELTPVFSAYYKWEYTTNIYTRLNYMSNDLFFSGITFSGCNDNSCSNTINAVNLSLNNPKTLAVSELNDTGNITSINISTYYNEDIRNRNYFIYDNYLNIGFRIGDLAMNYNYMNGRNYTFGISSLASRILDNQTTTTPLPDNLLTQDKYNTCSAWYDIPCQLGNAITYIIYEAPIVSPVLTFVFSFINMFSSLVSFVDLFRSFGIVFGCFVLYMFINLLNKYSK